MEIWSVTAEAHIYILMTFHADKHSVTLSTELMYIYLLQWVYGLSGTKILRN